MEHPVPRYSFLAFQLNRMIDEGRSIPVDEAHARIRDRSLFDRLDELQADVTIYVADERRTIMRVLKATSGESSYGVTQNGLALCLACCIEAMQNPEAYEDDERFDE